MNSATQAKEYCKKSFTFSEDCRIKTVSGDNSTISSSRCFSFSLMS